MSQQRFEEIYGCCCCLRDLADDEEDDKLVKISPVVITIVSNSQFYYRPGRKLSIDEAMIPFSGRSKLMVYMPSKPTKYGLKAPGNHQRPDITKTH